MKDKTEYKKLWDFYKKFIDGFKETTVEPYTGFKIEVSYGLYIDGDAGGLYVDVGGVVGKPSKDWKEIGDFFGWSLCVEDVANDSIVEYIDIKEPCLELKKLVKGLSLTVEQIEDIYDHIYVRSKTFEDFWREIDKPEPKKVKLNRAYEAEIAIGSDIIKVGCQNFEVKALRELLEAHEKLNKK